LIHHEKAARKPPRRQDWRPHGLGQTTSIAGFHTDT